MAYEESSHGDSASSDSEESRASDGSPVLGSLKTGTLALASRDVVPHSCKHCQRLVFVFEDSANMNHEAGVTFSKPIIDFDFTYVDVAQAAWRIVCSANGF